MPISKVQPNSKIRSSNQQQQDDQQQQQQLPKQYIERDFLKENIEYVKIKSLKLQRLKFTSSCPIDSSSTTTPNQNKQQIKVNLTYSGSGKGDGPKSVFERLTAGTDSTRSTTLKKRLYGNHNDIKFGNGRNLTGGKQQQKSSIESDGLELLEKKIDQMVQTFDNIDDKFTDDAIIMEPTLFALKKIRDEREKQLQDQLKEKLLERRKFGKESVKLETHLNDLSEFLDTGSISRRKITTEQNKQRLKNVIYDRSFLKNLTSTTPTTVKKCPPLNDISENNIAEVKVSKIPLRTENKINNSVGDGPKAKSNNNNDDKLVVLYQRYKRDKRFYF